MPKDEIRILNGYRLILMPEHPRSMKTENWDGYVYEHIVVAEKYLGRPLRNDECVHHLDFNRSNNRKENLLVLLNSQHCKFHTWLDKGAPNVKALGMQGVNSGNPTVDEPTYCEACGRTLQSKQIKFCSKECLLEDGSRKSKRPSRIELEKDINSMSWLAIGKKYGVTDNGARKWAKAYGLPWKSRTKPEEGNQSILEGVETSG